MAVQVPWDKYEIALLIDAFWSVENRIADRNAAIEEVSEKLRNRARMQQIVVDDTFRNVAGVTLQYRAVEKLFFPNRWGTSASGLFAEMVNLYRYQRNEFDAILSEAKKQLQEDAIPLWAQKGTRREQFIAWLENKGIKNPHPNIIAMTFDRVTEFAEYSKALKCSIWDIGDVKVLVSLHQKLSGNHLFKVRLGEHAKIFEKTWKYYWQMLSDWESILKLQEEQTIAECTVERVEENYALPENRRVVFDDSLDLSHCTPVQATIFGKTEINFNKWEDVLLFVCRELVSKFPLKAKELLELTNSHLFVSTPATLKKPLHICDTFFTEGSFSTADLIHRIKVIVEAMGVSCDILHIYFERPEDFGEKMLSAFSDWLIEVCQLGEAEVQNHLAAIKALSKIMIMDGIIAKELYCCKTIEDVIVELNAIKKSPQYRNLYQYRFEDILKRYLAFRSEKIAPVKVEQSETTPAAQLVQQTELISEVSVAVTENKTEAVTEIQCEPVNAVAVFEFLPAFAAAEQNEECGQSDQVAQIEELVLLADIDGLSYDDIKTKLGITMVATKRLVGKSNFIIDIKGKLIHQNALIDWEEGADALEEILTKLMKKNSGYVTSSQLFEYARLNMKMFLNDNDLLDERAVYDMAQHLFEKTHYHGKTFAFRGKMHISLTDVGIESNMDVYKKYAIEQGGVFSFNGLIEHLESIGTGAGNLRSQMRMHTEPVFFFYDQDFVVYNEALHIDDAWKTSIAQSLDALFEDVGDHMILRSIPSVWFERLPAISGNYPWTPLLLQGVLHFYGEELGARTIQALDGQSLETVHTMLTTNDSPIRNFGDVVVCYLLEQNIERRNFEAEELRQLLVDGGLLHGNELIWNMPKALKGDERFAWDAIGNQVIIKI